MRQKINPDPLSHFVREGAGNMRFAASERIAAANGATRAYQ